MEAVAVEEKIDDDGGETMSKIESHHWLFQSEEVLINVLSKLPVKTLFRFRCVCKRWLYLISDDPYFFQLHSQNSKSKPLILFGNKCDMRISPMPVTSMDRDGNPISSFEFSFNAYLPDIIPTRFDLVCIRDGYADHIVNPSTHEFITLPDPPYRADASVGFGYVESTDEYKVVRLTYSVNATCQVFTLRTTSPCSSSSSSSWAWREAVDPPIDVEYASDPTFVNGAIHWIIYGDPVPDKILAFDVESEEFRLVRLPEDRPERKLRSMKEPRLVELKGLLSISYTIDSKMDVWMLRDYYCTSGNNHISGSWVKEFSIDLTPNDQLKDRLYSHTVPRDIEETKVLIEKYAGVVGYYDLLTKRFEELVHGGQMKFGTWSFYVESLCSLRRTISKGQRLKQLKQKRKRLINP